jgi:hypothetical protein
MQPCASCPRNPHRAIATGDRLALSGGFMVKKRRKLSLPIDPELLE